jgi:hypothetical protein
MRKCFISFLLAALILAACTGNQPSLKPSSQSLVPTLATQTSITAPATLSSSPTTPPLVSSPSLASATAALAPTQEATSTPLPVRTFMPQRVTQLGGGINGITIVGDVAYVGMGPRLAAIDISQHEHPRLIRQSEPLPGLVNLLLQISSGEDPLLLISAGKYLLLVDPSNPDGLIPGCQLELEGAISALVWDAGASKIYAGMSAYQQTSRQTGIISSIDFTSDNQLKIISSVSMPEYPLSLALGKDGLFAGAEGGEGGLYHIHLNSSGTLFEPHQVIASGPEEPLQPLYLEVIGDYLYLSYRDIEAYDITNPDQPKKIWSQHVTGIDIIKGFNVVGDQVYAFGWTILSVFMRGAAHLPEPITGSPLGEIATVTSIHNGDFLVANNDLEIYATANPPDLKMIGMYQPPVINVLDATVKDKTIYVFDIGDGGTTTNPVIRVFSLPDLEPLGELTTGYFAGTNFYGIAVEGDRLYIAHESGLWAYNVRNSDPLLLGKVELPGGQVIAFAPFKVNEKRLLFAALSTGSDNNFVQVYDLTDLQKPTPLGNPLPIDQGFSIRMTWSGSFLYVLLEYLSHSSPNSSMLYVIDYVNSSLELKGSLEIPGYVAHLAGDNSLIMLAGDRQLTRQSFVSVVAPQPLRLLSQPVLSVSGDGLAIIDDMALIAVGYQMNGYQVGAAQLLAYDIRDPAHPGLVSTMDFAASTNYRVSILLATPYVVLANGAGGLEVLEYAP